MLLFIYGAYFTKQKVKKENPINKLNSLFIGCIIFGVDEEILHSHLFLYKKIETYEFFR